MTEKYQDWLAANVIAEEKTVTYRLLSRALKVHANTAKQMLYAFHQTQNARKPSSVYATYLISGVRKSATLANGENGSHKDGEDSAMADVSFGGVMSSSMPEHGEQNAETIPVTTITLLNEAKLADIKADYESISSIHIYSLSPGPLADLQALSDCNRRLAIEYSTDDPLETWKTYGTIYNPKARRRATRVPPPAATPASNVTAGMKPNPASVVNNAARPGSTPSSKATDSKAASQTGVTPTPTAAKKPQTVKRESSNLMASFGKTAASNAKLKLNTPADGADDGADDAMEEDQPAAPEETAEQRARAEAARKDKAAKEAKLRAMMEGDDEEEKEKEDADEEMKEAWSESEHEHEPEPEPEPQGEVEVPGAGASAEQGVTTTDGRRRGRRRVMKKKTTKDAEGYLVTKEEAAWESFSEDEAPAPVKVESAAKKVKIEVSATAGEAAKKSTGGAAKKGQGSIRSFFKK